MTFTAEQQAAYLASPNPCPYCGSEMIEGGSFDTGTGQCWQKIFCKDCEHAWYDVYELKLIEEIQR